MDKPPVTLHPVSPTIRRHKRQVVWQVFIPFGVVASLVIAAAAWVAFTPASPTALWRDVSLVWLLAPALVLALGLLAVLWAAVYGLARLLKVLPPFTARLQEYSLIGFRSVRRLSDGTARPFIWVGQVRAAIRSIFKF